MQENNRVEFKRELDENEKIVAESQGDITQRLPGKG